jgi:peptidase M50B-like protein
VDCGFVTVTTGTNPQSTRWEPRHPPARRERQDQPLAQAPAGQARNEGAQVHATSPGEIWHRVITVQPLPPAWLVAASGLLALAVVLARRSWRIARNVVTIAHEGGHALVALATGRRLAGVRLHQSTAGETISAGRPAGAGVVLTTAAGYVAPSLLGLGAAALLADGRLVAMLLISLLLLAGLAAAMRNAYGLVAVLAAALTVVAVCWLAPPQVQAGFAYAATWFLLLGAVRPVLELQRGRRRPGGAHANDADDLARLTHVPGVVWVGMFGLTAVAAAALGGSWLVR